MPNEPKKAKEKRREPQERQNAQGDHEGSAHSPEEFEVMKPEKPKPANKKWRAQIMTAKRPSVAS